MNRTKSVITEAFWQLLDEKPYNKITVKDIVDRCQINRNTFYYHFHDIPELLEDTIKMFSDYVIQNYSKFGSPIDCLTPIVEYSLEHKKAILHIYRSIQREVFLNNLEHVTLYFVTQYIDTVVAEVTLPATDRALLIRFYKCILVGVILDWLKQGMEYDLLESAIRISVLFQDCSTQAILKAANLIPGNLS